MYMLADATPQINGIPEWIAALLSGNLSLGAALLFIWWKWVQPLLQVVTDRHLTFLDSIEKSQERITTAVETGPQLHQITHMKIDAVHNDVKRLRPRPDSDLKDVK